MIIQLQPQIRMHTPKGLGYANFLVDRGMDFDNEWIVFLDNGEIWSFLNSKVRVENNITYDRVDDVTMYMGTLKTPPLYERSNEERHENRIQRSPCYQKSET